MTSNWESFKKKQIADEAKPQGRMIEGAYRCEVCYKYAMEGKYFPVDQVLRYVCDEGHVNYIQEFKLAF